MSTRRTPSIGQVLFFSGSADGRHFFRGVCGSVVEEGGKITFGHRVVIRYAFEPGDIEPRRTAIALEPLTLPTNDYRIRITEALALLGPTPE